MKEKHSVKVTFENNDIIITDINGSKESISQYYSIGKVFNIGNEKDKMTAVKKLEFLTEKD